MNKKTNLIALFTIMLVILSACGKGMKSRDLLDFSPNDDSMYEGASIDFEDENLNFAMEVSALKGGDASKLSIIQLDDSKVLTTTNVYGGGEVFIGFDAAAILGDRISQVKTIQLDIGVTGETFNAVSGKAYAYTGENNTENMIGVWSVYLESDNPKTVAFTLDEPFEAGYHNFFVISKESDAALDVASGKEIIPTEITIDNIGFFDEEGNLISADTLASIGGDSALIPRVSERMLYGREVCMECTYAGDGERSASIPAEYFKSDNRPVCVTIEYELLDGYNAYSIKPVVDSSGECLTSDAYVGSSAFNGDFGAILLDDGTIEITDKSLSTISFNLTAKEASRVAANGGLSFEVNGVICKSAIISDNVYLSYIDKSYVGDWEKTTNIAANLFTNANGSVNVTLDIDLCPGYDNYMIAPVIEARNMPTFKPSDYVGITTGESTRAYHLQDDGFFVIDDSSIKSFSFTITKEAAERVASEDGMAFLVYGVGVRKARVSDVTYKYSLDNSYVGDWNNTVCIMPDAFEGVDSIMSVDLAISLEPGYDRYVIAPSINDVRLTHLDVSDYVDLKVIDTGCGYHLEDDGSIIIDDRSIKSLAFTLNSDAVKRIAIGGGLTFQVYGVHPKDAILSTSEFKYMIGDDYKGDWGGTDAIPIAFYQDVQGPVTFTAHISALPDYEYYLLGIVANQSGWPKYINFDEYVVAANPTIDGTGTDYHLQEDGFIKVENPLVARVSETFSAQGAYKAEVDGGILYQVYGVGVSYITIIR